MSEINNILYYCDLKKIPYYIVSDSPINWIESILRNNK